MFDHATSDLLNSEIAPYSGVNCCTKDYAEFLYVRL